MTAASTKSLILMGSLFLICSLMVIDHLFAGVAAVGAAAVALRVLSAAHVIRPLTRGRVRIVTVTGIAVLIAFSFASRNPANSFISLLILGCALKFLEYAQSRDLYVQCTALTFLSAVPLIFHYDFYVVVYIAGACALILWSFAAVTHRQTVREDLRLLFKIMFPAVPVAAVMFFVIPRTGAFWVIPSTDTAVSGISERLDFENIGSLAQSDKLVARAIFRGPVPERRYFRVIAYENYRDSGWEEGSVDRMQRQRLRNFKYLSRPKPKPVPRGAVTDYDVVAEALNTAYVPTLRYSVTDERRLFYLFSDVYSANSSSSGRQYYRFKYLRDLPPAKERLWPRHARETSYYDARAGAGTLRLVGELTAGLGGDRAKADAILAYFAGNGFEYTLSPGGYPPESFPDNFVLGRKQGFCVHFAGAMALMLRMAGISSRVVGGYMGGEVNPEEGLVTIREYDAHAWVEAYVDGSWIEYDPTAMVTNWNPLSVSSVIAAANGVSRPSSFMAALTDLKDYIDLNWSRFILNFDTESQNDIFRRSFVYILLTVFAGFAVYGAAVVFALMRTERKRVAPELRIMQKAVRLMARRDPGVRPEKWHTYARLGRDLRAAGSPYAGKFGLMSDVYTSLRYRRDEEGRELLLGRLRALLRDLAKIRPAPARKNGAAAAAGPENGIQ